MRINHNQNKTIMKKITYIIATAAILCIVPLAGHAQLSFQGVDLTNFTAPTHWQRLNNGKYIKKSSSTYFDFVSFSKGKNGKPEFVFMAGDGSGMAYVKVSRALRQKFGTADVNKDYIPKDAQDDPEYLATLVDLKKAEVVREWELPDKNLKIYFMWEAKFFSVSFQYQ
jgi:hypothetical protein